MYRVCLTVLLVALVVSPRLTCAQALPFLPPGDTWLRHEVELEQDEGRIPLSTTWPLPTGDVPDSLRETLRPQMQPGSAQDAGWFASAAARPEPLRTFNATPRENGEAGVQAGWAAGDYAGGAIRLAYDFNPKDQMHYRADGSYAAWRFGNWWATLGMQERWWGPGWDGSLILSNNARPMPGIGLERASAKAPDTWLLHWVGPWRLVTFMDRFEDKRVDFPHPLLWGLRVTFRPLDSLEVGLSRTAQWCHPGVCGFKAFKNVVLGHDNAGINVTAANQPGNQEAGWDLRWHVPRVPIALYWQLNGEDLDHRNYRPRQTTQLAGIEMWGGRLGARSWRSFIEAVDTTCGGISTASSDRPSYGCAYENGLFTGGYRFRDRIIGDSLDRDGRMYTFGLILVEPCDCSYQLRIRRASINRGGIAQLYAVPQTLSPVKEQLWNAEVMIEGAWRRLRYSIGADVDRSRSAVARTEQGRFFLSLSRQW